MASVAPDIQTLVTRAVAQGHSEVRLPAGTHFLSCPLFIPPCTNLTIRAEGCILKHKGTYTGRLLAVAMDTSAGMGTDSQLPNYSTRIGINAIASRDASTFTPDSSVSAGYWLLCDPDVYTTYDNGGSPATENVSGELVYVASSGNFGRQPTRIVSGGTGLGTTYGANSYLISAPYTSQNLTILGLELDGGNTATGYADILAIIWAVDGLVHDIKLRNFTSVGLRTVFCRNVTHIVKEIAYSNGTSGGQGYGIEDNRIMNAELYSPAGKNGSPAFYDTGSAAQGIRHCWVKSRGCADCWQHDYKAHNLKDDLTAPAVEAGAHVGPSWHTKANDINCTGTARGFSGGGHQKFGYPSYNVTALDIDANAGDFLMAAVDTCTYTRITNYRYRVFIGWGDRSGLTTGAFPLGPNGCKNVTLDSCSGQRSYTGTGYDANQERLEGTTSFIADELISTEDAQLGRYRSEANCTISFSGACNFDATSSLFRLFDIGNGAGNITINNTSTGTYRQRTVANTREAFRLLTTGTCNDSTNWTWSGQGGAARYIDSGTWAGEP